VTVTGALLTALLTCALLLLAFATLIVVKRLLSRRAERRALALTAPLRPALFSLLGADLLDDEATEALEVLAAVDAASWRALEPTVVSLLTKVRGDAAEALTGLLARRGTLARALEDCTRRDPVRRCRGAELLGATRARDGVPTLVRLLADRDPEVRAVAVRALGAVGDPAAAPHLLGALAGDRTVPPRLVAVALVRLCPGPEEVLVSALSDSSELVRGMAAEVLGLAGAVTARTGLVEAVSDPAVEVRVRAARALGRLGVPSALPVLLDALAPEQPTALRVAAAAALGQLGSPSAVPTLRAALDDPATEVARAAASALPALAAPGIAALREAAVPLPALRPPRRGLLRALDADSGGAEHAREVLALLDLRAGRFPDDAGVQEAA
jgi:HEAT repeat protein